MTPDVRRALGVVYALGDHAPRIAEVRSLLRLPAGDVFDERLQWAVRGVQATAGLPVTGWLSKATLAAIDRLKGVTRDSGVAEQVVITAIGVVGTVAAGAPMVVVAVSEEAARNAQFGAAVIAAIMGFGAILGWFARLGLQASRKLDALSEVRAKQEEHTREIAALAAKADAIGAQQVTLARYEADRAADRAEAERIFAVAEANRIAAEKSGVEGLVKLPYTR